MDSPLITAWTRQEKAVWDQLQTQGVYTAREAYVRAKNGAIADYYLEAYRWFTRESRKYLSIPEGLTIPIWLAITQDSRLPPAPGTVSLTLEIPREQMLIVDYDKWGYRINDWYVPLDAEDEARHDAELRRFGIGNEALLFLTDRGNYYPQLRQKILRSWQRIFTPSPTDPSRNVGTVWVLRREWVREVEDYG